MSSKTNICILLLYLAFSFAVTHVVCYLCNCAISWLMSSNSLMPVNSPDPIELELSCRERMTDRGEEGGEGGGKKTTGWHSSPYLLNEVG